MEVFFINMRVCTHLETRKEIEIYIFQKGLQ